jgi:hypothetical protein
MAHCCAPSAEATVIDVEALLANAVASKTTLEERTNQPPTQQAASSASIPTAAGNNQ